MQDEMEEKRRRVQAASKRARVLAIVYSRAMLSVAGSNWNSIMDQLRGIPIQGSELHLDFSKVTSGNSYYYVHEPCWNNVKRRLLTTESLFDHWRIVRGKPWKRGYFSLNSLGRDSSPPCSTSIAIASLVFAHHSGVQNLEAKRLDEILFVGHEYSQRFRRTPPVRSSSSGRGQQQREDSSLSDYAGDFTFDFPGSPAYKVTFGDESVSKEDLVGVLTQLYKSLDVFEDGADYGILRVNNVSLALVKVKNAIYTIDSHPVDASGGRSPQGVSCIKRFDSSCLTPLCEDIQRNFSCRWVPRASGRLASYEPVPMDKSRYEITYVYIKNLTTH